MVSIDRGMAPSYVSLQSAVRANVQEVDLEIAVWRWHWKRGGRLAVEEDEGERWDFCRAGPVGGGNRGVSKGPGLAGRPKTIENKKGMGAANEADEDRWW